MATAAFEDIVADFEFLDDWEDRYRHVIDLGKAMDPLEDAFKVPATKVDGCASQVWLVPNTDGGQFSFRGDSDAMIVRGLIAVLQALYNGVPVADIAGVTCNYECLAEQAGVPVDAAPGDVIAFLNTGSYIEVYTCNFNALPRPATVLVNGDKAHVIKRRETLEEVFGRDEIPAHLA